MTLAIGIDIGGTFTDFVLEAPSLDGPRRHTLKLATTPTQPERAVLDGVRLLLASAGARIGDVSRLVHGTTLATNALIERRGARTAFLTTAGFRDVLVTGNESRAAQYELFYRKPTPLVPRRWRLPVGGRIGAQGQELAPLDEAAVIAHAAEMRAGGIESIAVGYLHAYAAPAHERRTGEILADLLPDIPVSLSCEVSPEIREYERFCTTVANAYVRPVMAAYLARLQDGLRAQGLRVPVLLMLSSGGLATVATAMRFPVRLLESGPAGGAVFASRIARHLGIERALAFDMGGTTAKLCLLDDGEPRRDSVFEVDRSYRFAKGSGMPVRVPVIELVEIGAGGGSIARVDPTGRLRVGPESAGAEPGPACFGRGGTQPTVTDANLALGRLDPERFGGGRVHLDAAAAIAALCRVSDAAPMRTAGIMIEVVEAAMAAAARVHAAERGAGLEDRVLIAFGGGAPLHAIRLAALLGVRRVIVPPDAGVGSALGFLWATPSYQAVRGFPRRLEQVDSADIAGVLDALADQAMRIVRPALPAATPCVVRRAAQLRYRGQGQDVTVPLSDDAPDATDIADRFVAAYQALYGAPIPGVGIDVIALSVTVSAPPTPADLAVEPAVAHQPRQLRERAVWSADAPMPTRWGVFDRAQLGPGACVTAPVLVLEAGTTTAVPAGWTLHVDGSGMMIIDRDAPATVLTASAA